MREQLGEAIRTAARLTDEVKDLQTKLEENRAGMRAIVERIERLEAKVGGPDHERSGRKVSH
jgi:uncharacterized protein (UPF0335 family)